MSRKVNVFGLGCHWIPRGRSLHELGNQFGFLFQIKLEISKAWHVLQNVLGGISGVCTNPDKCIYKESCSVRIVTIASHIHWPPDWKKLQQTFVCNVFQKFKIEKTDNSAQHTCGKRKLGITDLLQIYWYIDIPVSFLYMNTHFCACTHTHAYIKWIRFVLKLLTTVATLFTSQRQPYSLQKSSGRKISKAECAGF